MTYRNDVLARSGLVSYWELNDPTIEAVHRSLFGNQPSSSGSLTRVKHAARTLAGNQPSPSGTLSYALQRAPMALTDPSIVYHGKLGNSGQNPVNSDGGWTRGDVWTSSMDWAYAGPSASSDWRTAGWRHSLRAVTGGIWNGWKFHRTTPFDQRACNYFMLRGRGPLKLFVKFTNDGDFDLGNGADVLVATNKLSTHVFAMSIFNINANDRIYNVVLQQGAAGTPTDPHFIDDVRFITLRAAYNPLSISDHGRSEHRSDNIPFNYCPLLAKPAFGTLFDVGNDAYTAFDGYYEHVDGNFAGTTEQILEWAAEKWGFGTRAPVHWENPTGAPTTNTLGQLTNGTINYGGMNLPDLFKAQAINESNWYQSKDYAQGFGDWSALRDTLLGSAYAEYCYNSHGIMQVRAGDGTWPPVPHAIFSTAWAADYCAAKIRMDYDGASFTSGGGITNKTVGNLARAVANWFYGSPNNCGVDLAYSTYARRIFGGTSLENGVTYTGNINKKTWESGDPSTGAD